MNDKFKNDKLKFELIRNADLVCTDCLYKYDDTNMPCKAKHLLCTGMTLIYERRKSLFQSLWV